MRIAFGITLLLCLISVVCCQAATPEIFAAVKAGNLDYATQIVEKHPEQVNARNELGQTPLHLAAMSGKVEMVSMLLSHRASPAFHDTAGKLAIDYASEKQHDDIVKLLEGVVAVPDDHVYLSAFQKDGLWGFVDLAGRVKLAPRWTGYGINRDTNRETPPHFSEGLAPMKGQQQWGVIDLNGQWVISPQYDGFGDFYKGIAPFKSGDKWGLLDTNGNEIFPAKFNTISNFSEDVAWIGDNFIDMRGNVLLKENISGTLFENIKDGIAIVLTF